MPINQHSAEEAYNLVLENAVALLPKRDAVDSLIIKEVNGGFAANEGKSYKKTHKIADTTVVCGIIDTHNDVGGWPELKSDPPKKDQDHDGLPDVWEDKNKLDKTNPDDRNNIASDGYTMLEKYLNSIR
jgi:pectate lyase